MVHVHLLWPYIGLVGRGCALLHFAWWQLPIEQFHLQKLPCFSPAAYSMQDSTLILILVEQHNVVQTLYAIRRQPTCADLLDVTDLKWERASSRVLLKQTVILARSECLTW